jgi:hypothetical protein
LGLSDSARLRLGLAEAGPDLKIICFTFLMHVFYFWILGRFLPSLNLAKTVGPKSAEAEARPGGPAGRLTSLELFRFFPLFANFIQKFCSGVSFYPPFLMLNSKQFTELSYLT